MYVNIMYFYYIFHEKTHKQFEMNLMITINANETITQTDRHTIDRLPPGVVSISVHEVDDIFNAMAVPVVVRVVAVLGVTLKTLVRFLWRTRRL